MFFRSTCQNLVFAKLKLQKFDCKFYFTPFKDYKLCLMDKKLKTVDHILFICFRLVKMF